MLEHGEDMWRADCNFPYFFCALSISARPSMPGKSSELVTVYIGFLGIMKEARISYNFFRGLT